MVEKDSMGRWVAHARKTHLPKVCISSEGHGAVVAWDGPRAVGLPVPVLLELMDLPCVHLQPALAREALVAMQALDSTVGVEVRYG